ncbi:DHHC palmitoyltransferase domain-containing protein [Trichoderma evansii]
MDALKKVILIILAISFMVFVTFFGRLPALRKTPIAWLYRLIWVHFPNLVTSIDQKLTSGRVTGSLVWLFNRLMYDRHPTIVIFFLLIMTVSEYLYLPQIWPKISLFTKSTVLVTVVVPYVLLYLACAADPGYITRENHAYHMSLYPYDHALFHPGNECRTCRFIKPPRSKHCDVCKRCIARADHHCVFINSCVGYGNHHWFLLLLVSECVLSSYGGILGLYILKAKIKAIYPMWSLWPPKDMDFNKYFAIWGVGLHGDIRVGASTLLAILISPLIWGLTIYTIFLIYCGTTTNESMKWTDLKEDMRDGYAFRRPLAPNRLLSKQWEPPSPRWPSSPECIIMTTLDGQPPNIEKKFPGEGQWEHVWDLKDVENIYDLGFWHNMGDVFVSNYEPGDEANEPLAERRPRGRSISTKLGHPQ